MHETNCKYVLPNFKIFIYKKYHTKHLAHFWVNQFWSVGPLREALILSDMSISISSSLSLSHGTKNEERVEINSIGLKHIFFLWRSVSRTNHQLCTSMSLQWILVRCSFLSSKEGAIATGNENFSALSGFEKKCSTKKFRTTQETAALYQGMPP